MDVVACAEHRALAREAAWLGSVLLRNSTVEGSPVLPLNTAAAARIAVLGPLIDAANLGDMGSSRVRPPEVLTVIDALRHKLGADAVHIAPDRSIAAAVRTARTASAAVVVVGLTSVDEGESMSSVDADAIQLLGGITKWRTAAVVLAAALRGIARRKKMGGDRRDLRLHPDHISLIQAVAAVNARTIVVIVGGGTIVVDPWDTDVAAILMVWYPGMEGGAAIADMLLGDAEPGGRLPLTIPHRRTDLPTVDWTTTTATYGRWWGQRHLDRNHIQAAFPFGYGLGYSTFRLTDLRLAPVDGEGIDATVTVTNTGVRPGRHVVQIYATPDTSDTSAARVLLGFQPVHVDAGDTVTVTVHASTRSLQHWTGDGFILPAPAVTVEAASYCGDPDALTVSLTLQN
jgi:beta-glucosidase